MRNDEFLALIRHDRREAGAWLVSALGGRVWGLARRWLGADAENGVQEVFREMFRSLDREERAMGQEERGREGEKESVTESAPPR